jgi:hypothetical protein
MAKESIASVLHRIDNSISGAKKSPEILSKLSVFGYTPEKIKKGNDLLDVAKQKTVGQVDGYGDQYAASDELNKKFSLTYDNYMVTTKIVRIAFKGRPDMLARLRATGKRHRSLSGWLNDARIMYWNILDNQEAVDTLANFGYSVEKITAERDAVEEVQDLQAVRLSEKGEAQQGTVDRDKAIDELCDWYSDFRAVARIALYDSPQLLEALGIVKK